MKILYSALDQVVPGTTGGATHVRAVAEGLAARGYEVHVLAGEGPEGFPAGAVTWHRFGPPLGRRQLRWAAGPRVARLAVGLRPDVVVERYYNFGGEGLTAAVRSGARYVLEVNAPVVDYAGSPKARLDRALIVEPMRRWRDRLCRQADLVVTPSARTLPTWVPPERVLEVEWGADVERFRPGAAGPVPYGRDASDIVAIFAGAFRSWHGARFLVDALRLLHERGAHAFRAVLVGAGPEWDVARERAAGLDRITFTGALPHDRMPAALAAADIGVAPFDVAAHPPLQLDFYWSPLKVFEYMASGLPVVAPRIERLGRLVREGREGVLYDPPVPAALADALERLTDEPLRRRLGAAARARVVAEFSWAEHCRRLDEAITAMLGSRPARSTPHSSAEI
jgi:glycosyltransferase involved in cell wall biosynthesis